MQEKREAKSIKIRKVCVVGVIPSFAFQRAKYCAFELHRKLPMRFPPPEIIGLLELDWNEKLTEWKQTFGRDFWCLRRPVAVFFDNKFIGSDIDLIKLATIRHILFENVPRENMSFLKESFRNDYISYLKKTKRIYCYLDICVDGVYVGTLNFELFSDLVPKTCENFKTLCLGSKGPLFSYRGSRIHRIVKEGWVQGGDIQYKKGGGGYSIFCDPFEDECLGISHNRRGVLSMANFGRNSNGSQFFITLKPNQWMDSRFVAFGQLIEGSPVLKLIENLETSYECPLRTIEIKSCGRLDLGDEENVDALHVEEIPSKKKPKKFEKISEQILRLIMEALTNALEKKEHRMDILDNGDVPSKMNLQLYFEGLYSIPEEILIKSAEYLRNLRRQLLRVAKPSATEIVEVLTYDLLVATLTRMINLDDMRETLGPDLYKKMISKIDMQLELCQKPYIKRFVDQVVSTAESMVDLVTKKLLHMKKMSKNIKIFQEKMEKWLQSFVLQEVFKDDCYHISDRSSWNKNFKKENNLKEKEKELSKRQGEKCCEEKKKRKEREILDQIKKKYNPDDFCCLGKKVFEDINDISLHDFFSTCRYDLKKVPKSEEKHRMPLLDMIEFSRCRLKCMRKQGNKTRSSKRMCLEEKIKNWMNEIVYTPETMWIRNLIFGKDDIVYNHMEEILYGAMTVGLLEMYYFYEQYLKLCGGKKRKVITRTIYPNEDQKLRGKSIEESSETKKDTENNKITDQNELLPESDSKVSLPECTCGHPCCVCAFDPHYARNLEKEKEEEEEEEEEKKESERPLSQREEKLDSKKNKILKSKKKLKICPSDMEMIDLNKVMAESTYLKPDEIDIKSFRWLKPFILEKGCDLKSEFVTQVHNWLDGERFNFQNFISKHSLVTKASLLSLSLSLAEFIVEENKMKTEITNFIYDLWELYFHEMFKEALLQYPPEEGTSMEEETKVLKKMSKSEEHLAEDIIKKKLEGKGDAEEEKEKDFEKDLENACKKIISEASDFDFTKYCKTYQNELEDKENDELEKKLFLSFQDDEAEAKMPPNSNIGVEKAISTTLSQETSNIINEEDAEKSNKILTKEENELEQKTKEEQENQLERKVTISMPEEEESVITKAQEEKKEKHSFLDEKKYNLSKQKKFSETKDKNEMPEKERRKIKKRSLKEQVTKSNTSKGLEFPDRLEKEKEEEGEDQKENYDDDLSVTNETLNQSQEILNKDSFAKSEEFIGSDRHSKISIEKKKSQSPIIIEEIVSDHSSLEDSRQMPPYVLPFWIKFLTQLTKQALGTIAQISRLPRRLYFSQRRDNDFEDKVKDWIEFNAFNPQPTKGREIMDFISLHHKSVTNLEESVRSYLTKKKFSLMLNRCTRIKSAETIANDLIAAILEATMTKVNKSNTVELYVSKVMSSAITSVQQESELTMQDKYSLNSYLETNEKDISLESETVAEE